MRINLNTLYYFEPGANVVDVYNLAPYINYALDIFIYSETKASYDFLLEPLGGDPLIKLEIDGDEYPIARGLEGSSPLNPIIYKGHNSTTRIRSWSATGANEARNGLGTSLVYVGSNSVTGSNILLSQEEQDSTLPNYRIIGQNIITSDYLPISILFNNQFDQGITRFGYGGTDIDENDVEGYGGYDERDIFNPLEISAYGGVKIEDTLEDIILVIQPSQYTDLDENNGEVEYGIKY
jgi:hypothetical protein